MTEENPTGSDAGASITDRLERFLAPEPPAKEPKQEAPSQDVEPPAEGAETTEEPESGEPNESQQPQLTTTDLAKVLGIDESALDVDGDGNISIKTKIDGKEGAAKFADLVKSYQLQGHAENRTREVAQKEAALQARQQEVEQAFQQKLANAEQLTEIAAKELMNEYQSIDWKALDQHEDQGAVAALKFKFQERQQRIQNAFQGINAQKAQLNQQAEVKKAERIQAEAAKLPTFIPEWKDAAVQAKESKELIDWGLKSGYPMETLQSLNHSSALDVATFRKAMMFDKLQQSKVAVENKVRLAPKIVKPGQAQQDNSAGQKLQNLKHQIVKSGGKKGIAEYLLAAGKV